MQKLRTSKEEIALIKEYPNDKHSIKLVAILYGQAKKGSDDEAFLYDVLIRRCTEEAGLLLPKS